MIYFDLKFNYIFSPKKLMFQTIDDGRWHQLKTHHLWV